MNDFDGMTDAESMEFQLWNWVDGRSMHNPIRDECCPDFSCCTPGVRTPKVVRQRFLEAYKRKEVQAMREMRVSFIAAAFASHGVRVGDDEKDA